MKTIYFLLFTLLSQVALAQSDFVTRWDLSKTGYGATQLKFGVATAGPVSYTWTEVSPGTATGSGVFSGSTLTITGLPTGATIELRIAPTNFRRIIINNEQEKNRLIDISQWGTVPWSSMAYAFWGCANLQVSATDLPDLSGVTDMALMFRGCSILNGPANIGDWDTSNVTNMSGLFLEATAFNQPVGNWNTQNVYHMTNLFRATAFNHPIGNWNTQNVLYMNSMFSDNPYFNQDVGDWNVEKVTDMQFMFFNAPSFNQYVGNWTLNPSVKLRSIFNASGVTCYSFSEILKGWSANPKTPNGLVMSEMPHISPSAVPSVNYLINNKGWNFTYPTTYSPTECLGASSYFTTRWNLSTTGSGDNQLSFGVATSGDVDYTWKELSPGNATGSGTFNGSTATITDLPAGALVELQISPVNFERIVINNGTDKDRLVNISQWGITAWSSMAEAFSGCANLKITASDVPNLSTVANMRSMFSGCTSLDGPENIGDWKTQNVTDMSSMFDGALAFNQSLGNWTLNASVNLASVFDNSGLGCYSYSETLKGWSANPATPNGLSLTTDGKTYNPGAAGARSQLIDTKQWTIGGDVPSGAACEPLRSVTEFVTRWKLSATGSGANQLSFGVATSGSVNYTWTEISPGIATGSGTFSGSTATITGLPVGATIELRIAPDHFQRFIIDNGADKNRLIEVRQWGSTRWSSMQRAFYSCAFLQISAKDVPDLSNVTDMSLMFNGCVRLNGPANIGSWNTEKVENMTETFLGASAFNQPIGSWNTGKVTSFYKMFRVASAFNQNIGGWATGEATNMSEMFFRAGAFNQDISGWNTGKVTNMSGMFTEARSFNQPIGTWHTDKVTNMAFLFRDASAFNQPINNWITENVTTMNGMFQNAGAFNRPLGWNTQNVANMSEMFRGASSFNQPVGNWNTESVTDMTSMFQGAGQFNQSVGNWTLNSAVNLTAIFTSSGLGCANYSATLIGWAANPATPNGRNLDVNDRRYNPSASDARDQLITAKGWTIAGDIAVGADCVMPIATSQFVTRWNLSTTGSGANQITFTVATSGSVNYTWTEISPGTATGSGTFSGPTVTITGLPTGATIDLRISPTNFQRFRIGSSADKDRLVDVRQWGAMVWFTTVEAFSHCKNLQISATDIPNLSAVTDMSSTFNGCQALNGPANIGSWNMQNVQNISYMFYGARAFNQPLGNWNTQNVRDMTGTFREAIVFNQPIGNWKTQNVTIMDNMFLDAHVFNQPIGNWDTRNVSSMINMFVAARAFNQPIANWDTQKVTDMSTMFSGAVAFNQAIGNWNTQNVTSMIGMFAGALAFNQPISNWNTGKVTTMNNMFRNAAAYNHPVGNWNMQMVTDLRNMFNGASAFDQSVGNWTLNASQGLTSIFTNSGLSCYNYGESLKGWAKASTPNSRTLDADGRMYSPSAAAARNYLVTNKGWTITGDAASEAECPAPLSPDEFVTRWDLSTTGSGATGLSFGVVTSGEVSYRWTEVSPDNARTAATMASGTGTFDGSTLTITGLPAGAVIELRIWPTNFLGITISNGADKDRLLDISQWGATGWRFLSWGFYGCTNLQVSATDLPNLSAAFDLSGMFGGCPALNGPANIGSWNTEGIYYMNNMFTGASAFNQPIGNWNIQNVEGMNSMFLDATAFDQSLGNWTLNPYVDMTSIFTNSGLDCYNYSQTLKGWSTNPSTPNGLYLDADGRTYGPSAANARNNLMNTKGWTINGDAVSVAECSSPLPVTLVSFSGHKNNENQNVLKWITADESDFDRFEVQRSENARSFEKIGVVYGRAATLSGATSVEYGFTDQSPDLSNYYRLKMIDRDGAFEYSRILWIQNAREQAVVGSFYPNPSSGKVLIDVTTIQSGRWILTVVDASGRNIARRTYNLQKGKNTIALEDFTNGINLVRFANGSFSEVRKLVRD